MVGHRFKTLFRNVSFRSLIWFLWGLGGLSAVGVLALLEGQSTRTAYLSTVGIGLFLIGLGFTLLVTREIWKRIWNLEHMNEILSGEALPKE